MHNIILDPPIGIVKRPGIPEIAMILVLRLILILKRTFQQLQSLINLSLVHAEATRRTRRLTHIPHLLNFILGAYDRLGVVSGNGA